MKFFEFVEYIEPRLTAKDYFIEQVAIIQEEKNRKRKPKDKWNQNKIDKVIRSQWDELLVSIYERVKTEKGKALPHAWIEFIENDDFLSDINEGILSIEFQ